MSNRLIPPSFFPGRVNLYVPAMSYSSDVGYGGEVRVDLGTPNNTMQFMALAAVQFAGSAQPVPGIIATPTVLGGVCDAPFGRSVTVQLSTAGAILVTVSGYDYLGQPMIESITTNGTTVANGNKAFKSVSNVSWAGLGSAANLTMRFRSGFGMPFKAYRAICEDVNGVGAAINTFATPDTTSPATASTNDPRGIYIFTATPDGSKQLSVSVLCGNDVDASNNGGLHGIQHFGG